MKKLKKKLAFALAGILFLCAYPAAVVSAAEPIDTTQGELPKDETERDALTEKAHEMTVDSNSLGGWPEGPQTYGEAGIVMEAESGAILYAKNIDGKAYPASITKILTALIALENGQLSDKVTFTQDSIDFLEYGDAHIGMTPGEEITLNDALHALLLASANEVAHAIAESTGEGYDWFIEQMNTRAAELGAVNSHFVNTNGLQDVNHYTTARDMALITRELYLHHPEFAQISQVLEYRIPPTNLVDEERIFQQKHSMFYQTNEYYDERVKAGKTGYTEDALNTLVTCADDGEMSLICVVLKTHGRNVYPDTKALLEYGFANFKKVMLSGQTLSPDIESVEEGAYVVLPSGITAADLDVELTPDETEEGAGTAVFTYQGNPVGSARVQLSDAYLAAHRQPEKGEKDEKDTSRDTSQDTSEKAPVQDRIPKWVYGVLIVLLLLVLAVALRILYVIRVRRRRRLRRMQRQRRRRQRYRDREQ